MLMLGASIKSFMAKILFSYQKFLEVQLVKKQ